MEAIEQGITRALQSTDVVLAEMALTAAALRKATQSYTASVKQCSAHLQTWSTFFSHIQSPNVLLHDTSSSSMTTVPTPTSDRRGHDDHAFLLGVQSPPAPVQPTSTAFKSTPEFTSPPITMRLAPTSGINGNRFMSALSLTPDTLEPTTTLHAFTGDILDISAISVVDTESPTVPKRTIPSLHSFCNMSPVQMESFSPNSSASFSKPFNAGGLHATDLRSIMDDTVVEETEAFSFEHENSAPVNAAVKSLDLDVLPSVYRSGIAQQQITALFNMIQSSPAPLTVKTIQTALELSEGVLNLMLDVLESRSVVHSIIQDGVRKWKF